LSPAVFWEDYHSTAKNIHFLLLFHVHLLSDMRYEVVSNNLYKAAGHIFSQLQIMGDTGLLDQL